MPKLKLNTEDVSVESFETVWTDAEARGTVRAQSNVSGELPCPTATCFDGCSGDCPTRPPYTWNQTCPPTCHMGEGCYSGAPQCPE